MDSDTSADTSLFLPNESRFEPDVYPGLDDLESDDEAEGENAMNEGFLGAGAHDKEKEGVDELKEAEKVGDAEEKVVNQSKVYAGITVASTPGEPAVFVPGCLQVRRMVISLNYLNQRVSWGGNSIS